MSKIWPEIQICCPCMDLNLLEFQPHHCQSSVCRNFGSFPSTVQPTETQVPKISFTVPANCLAIDLGCMILAISMTSSKEMCPLCLIFLTFFLSLSGSFKALITRAAALGTIATLACTQKKSIRAKTLRVKFRHSWDSAGTQEFNTMCPIPSPKALPQESRAS